MAAAGPGAPPRVRALVLAAGAGSRFGGHKLEARLAGRPLLQHVLDALAAAGIEDPIVVLPPDSTLEPSIAWRRAQRVVNPEPERGLASSLRLGWAAAAVADPAPDAVLVVLGDQPRLRPEVIRAIGAAPLDPARPVVAPRYAGSDARNPARIEVTPSGAALIAVAAGDRGVGPLLDARPALVRWLDVAGDNPDVDGPADLVAAIEADWSDRVRRNREQVERLRETPEEDDHYAPVAELFRDDPRRSGDAILDALLPLAKPGETWLDVGAGAGRYAFPLALAVREIIAVDPSAAMVAALSDGMRDHGIGNVRVIAGRWPEAATTLAPLPCADVALIASVGHDTEAIGPFVNALEAAAGRGCVAVMHERAPALLAAPFFEAVYGEPRIALPSLPHFLDLLAARGAEVELEMLERPARRWRSREELLTILRRQTWVAPGGRRDGQLVELVERSSTRTEDGFELATGFRTAVGIVRWSGRDQAGMDGAPK